MSPLHKIGNKELSPPHGSFNDLDLNLLPVGLAAMLLVNYVEVMSIDSLSLAGFQPLVGVGGAVSGAGLRLPAPHLLPHTLKRLNNRTAAVHGSSNLYL